MPRLRGRGQHRIAYRHVIDWLVRKPGAFAEYPHTPTSLTHTAIDPNDQSPNSPTEGEKFRRQQRQYCLGSLHSASPTRVVTIRGSGSSGSSSLSEL